MSVAQQATPLSEQRVLVDNIAWDQYVEVGRTFRDRPGLRITYSRGRLEIMTTSWLHELLSRLLHEVVVILTDEFDLPRASGGSATFRSELLEGGLEPDECYYIDNEPSIRGKHRIDLAIDPPPDLAIEIEVSRSAIDRLEVYSGLGVPEVWRYDGQKLTILNPAEADVDAIQYAEVARSRYFPAVPVGDIEQCLSIRDEVDERTLLKLFRQRVREITARTQ